MVKKEMSNSNLLLIVVAVLVVGVVIFQPGNSGTGAFFGVGGTAEDSTTSDSADVEPKPFQACEASFRTVRMEHILGLSDIADEKVWVSGSGSTQPYADQDCKKELMDGLNTNGNLLCSLYFKLVVESATLGGEEGGGTGPKISCRLYDTLFNPDEDIEWGEAKMILGNVFSRQCRLKDGKHEVKCDP